MTDKTRRQFVTLLGAGCAAVPVAGLVSALPSRARAADQPMVDPSSAQAKALEYIEVSEVDGQNCANCALYQGDDGSEAGACPLFSGNAVAAEGWCKSWVTKG